MIEVSVYPSQVQKTISPVLIGLASFTESAKNYVIQKEKEKMKEEELKDITAAQIDVYRLGGELPEWYARKSSAYKKAFSYSRGGYLANELARVVEYAVKRDPSYALDKNRFNKMFWDNEKVFSSAMKDEREMMGYAEKVVGLYEEMKNKNLEYSMSLEKAYAERGLMFEINQVLKGER